MRAKEQIKYWEQHGSAVFVVIVFIRLCKPVGEGNVILKYKRVQIQRVRPNGVCVHVVLAVYTEIHLQGCTEMVLFHNTMAVVFFKLLSV